MNVPTLTKTSVTIKYTADDGFRSTYTGRSGKGAADRSGEPTKPEDALLIAIAELARLTALFGFEQQAKEQFDAAQERVREWRKDQADQ